MEQDVVRTLPENAGFFAEWFVYMFTAAGEAAAANPTLWWIYFGLVLALVLVRIYLENPLLFFAQVGIYAYGFVQTYTLFVPTVYVIEPAGGEGWVEAARAVWFALLFLGVMMWGVSKAGQWCYTMLLALGLHTILSFINPMRLVNKLLGSNDALLDEEFEEGTTKGSRRQVATIMFTDVVGYSKMMAADEKGTLKKLAAHNDIMQKALVDNRGTLIKTIGDAFMVRFRSPINGVNCAIAAQRALKKFNAARDPNDGMNIRIGIHMGEVELTGNDAFGDGVNIAARIEPKSEAGGFAVSDAVHNEVKNKVEAHFVSMGRVPLKNIPNPPELFKAYIFDESQQPAGDAGGAQQAAAGSGATQGSGEQVREFKL